MEVTATNGNATRDAWYHVTVEVLDSRQRVVATETAHTAKIAAKRSESAKVYIARPADGGRLSVRIRNIKREFAAQRPEPSASSSADTLEKAMGIFVDEGLVPPGTPYGTCPDSAPQTWWIGKEANCWTSPVGRSETPTPPVPVMPGTLCVDGWISGSTGRGSCSHHGGIAR
ncbi:hypothetical protein ACFPH6_47115 [Streptomyces xiangluensis]|uniref:Uncharacterized protein n=1 Tax=Streptomyces xiangluensis TaxID=2665720 RepID=A0ABV8Z6Q6_9ACTN